MEGVRPAAVAGSFYPSSPTILAKTVRDLLEGASTTAGVVCPKALIVPHAGYIYSGSIAARAFACVAKHADRFERVVLVGPAHRVYVHGLVSPGVARMATPLGEVAVDADALAAVDARPHAAAHAQEHCLEVELPFIQFLARNARVVPLLASDARPDVVGRALETLWGGDETLIVISSDLSHYADITTARALDNETSAAIVKWEPIDSEHACGAVAINGLSWVARRKKLQVDCLELKTSGDTAGDPQRVVGYGTFAYYEAS